MYEQHAFYGIPPREEHLGTPYPGSFVLDETGRVVEKRFYQSYRERETGVGVLEDAFGAEVSGSGSVAASAAGPVRARAHLDSPTYRLFQRLHLVVELAIAPGIHVYGQPIPAGYVPLTLEVEPIAGMTVGSVQLPPTRPFQIEGLEEQFQVVQGQARLSVPLTFREEGPDLTVRGRIRYQACDETTCWPPTEWTFTLPLAADDLVGRPRKRD